VRSLREKGEIKCTTLAAAGSNVCIESAVVATAYPPPPLLSLAAAAAAAAHFVEAVSAVSWHSRSPHSDPPSRPMQVSEPFPSALLHLPVRVCASHPSSRRCNLLSAHQPHTPCVQLAPTSGILPSAFHTHARGRLQLVPSPLWAHGV